MKPENLKGVVHSDPQILGGTPVFVGTRVPLQRLCRALPGHVCISVGAMGWSGLTNGHLLRKAASKFDVFLTADSNLTFQQNLTKFDLAVIMLHPRSTGYWIPFRSCRRSSMHWKL